MFLTFGPLELRFPRLASSHYEITSDATDQYNCLAWAIGDDDSWWAPIEGDGIEKVALYADEENVTHVARQLPDGRWTSKLGSDCDIEHELEALEGFEDSPDAYRYGRVVAFMSRPRR